MATVLLVIPYFGGASYVYKNFIRPYISENSQIQKWNILFLHRRDGFRVAEQSTFLDATERNDIKIELEEEEKHVICQVGFKPEFSTDGIPSSFFYVKAGAFENY